MEMNKNVKKIISDLNINIGDVYKMFNISQKNGEILAYCLSFHKMDIDYENIYDVYYFYEFLNINNGFDEYIFRNYILEGECIDKLYTFPSIFKLSDKHLYMPDDFSDLNIFLKINKYIPIKKLSFDRHRIARDSGIIHLTELEMLNIADCGYITDDGIKHLTKLQTLSCRYCDGITGEGIKYLTQLRELDCNLCNNITDDGIKYIIQLQTLDCMCCKRITDEGIKHLTQLQKLDCGGCRNITNEGIKHLTQLQTLNRRQYERK